MKAILFLSFCILLMKSGYCEEEVVEDAPSEKTTTNDDPASDLQTADEFGENTDDTMTDIEKAKAAGLRLHFGNNGQIGLTITPNGGGGGTTYTRWGRTTCPTGASLVYEGYAAAGRYNQKGNGANFLCMPKDPQYVSTTNIPWPSCLYPGEYETNNQVFASRLQDHNVPCAVCYVPRSAKIMVPGKVSCPASWRREYYGYTMAGHMNHWQTIQYECVDITPQVVPGTVARRNNNGALFYFLQMECGYGIPCGGRSYIQRRAITCAICTK